jgi:hypothetical protein
MLSNNYPHGRKRRLQACACATLAPTLSGPPASPHFLRTRTVRLWAARQVLAAPHVQCPNPRRGFANCTQTLMLLLWMTMHIIGSVKAKGSNISLMQLSLQAPLNLLQGALRVQGSSLV